MKYKKALRQKNCEIVKYEILESFKTIKVNQIFKLFLEHKIL